MKLIILMISLLTPMINHPISLGSLLLIQTTLICLNLSFSMKTSWYSYILFITIIGGMMIMFMYMASISSNEKFFSFNWKKNIFFSVLIILTFLISKNDISTFKFLMKSEETKIILNEIYENKTMYKMFNFNKINITLMLMFILLITMISVTNISSSFEGPLKKTYV
uniref:NADH dehydrogenase subunit 6 n=1 Tax=Augilodes binghami TaxID=2886263 RepID=UPI001E788518|nr:NADH dehydrogenase subunit 6 [Augilodes binghami]UDL72055.1 NADH dehydrogenase subunit 6 [Augilodes binghami]